MKYQERFYVEYAVDNPANKSGLSWKVLRNVILEADSYEELADVAYTYLPKDEPLPIRQIKLSSINQRVNVRTARKVEEEA